MLCPGRWPQGREKMEHTAFRRRPSRPLKHGHQDGPRRSRKGSHGTHQGQGPVPEPGCAEGQLPWRATYLSLVRWADVEVVDDRGDPGLEGELGVGRPKV